MEKEENVHPSNRLCRTLAAYACAITLASSVTILGPSLVNVQYLLSTDTTHMAVAMACYRLAYIPGSFIALLLFSKQNISTEASFSLIISTMAVSLAIAPWLSHIYGFIIAMSIHGVAFGALQTGVFPYLMSVWEGHKHRDPILQGLHLIASIACTAVPYLVSLFLVDVPVNNSDSVSNITVAHSNGYRETENGIGVINNTSHETQVMAHGSYNDDRLDAAADTYLAAQYTGNNTAMIPGAHFVCWAYVTIAAIMFASACFAFVIFVNVRKKPPVVLKTKPSSPNKQSRKCNCYQAGLLVFFFLFFLFYTCVEQIPGGFLAALVVQGLGWHVTTGSIVTCLYWGAVGLGRVTGVFISWKLKPRTMIIINLFLICLGNAMLLAVSYFGGPTVWVAMAVSGFGIGSTFGSVYSWMAGYTSVTTLTSTIGLLGQAGPSVAVLILTGYMLDNHGYESVVYLLIAVSVLFFVTFIFMQLWASYADTKHGSVYKDEIEKLTITVEVKESTHDQGTKC